MFRINTFKKFKTKAMQRSVVQDEPKQVKVAQQNFLKIGSYFQDKK